MSSEPAGFVFGSASSAYSVRDAIASYRRAQLLVASSNVASSASDSQGDGDDDELPHESDQDFDEYEPPITDGQNQTEQLAPRRPSDGLLTTLQWDDDLTPGPTLRPQAADGHFLVPVRDLNRRSSRGIGFGVHRHDSAATEATPLLHDAVSSTEQEGSPKAVLASTAPRRFSASSAKSGSHPVRGTSTWGQTLFNSVAILLGIGMLSEPLAFACAGWLGGTVLIIVYGLLTRYTAKILGHIILSDSHLRSYADIGRKAFGPRSTVVISTMFVLELFAVSVALVTLYADSLHSIMPTYSPDTLKLLSLLILVPTVFMPLSLLSYGSIIGILSTVVIVVAVLADGLMKKEAPGSLWSPAHTDLVPQSLGQLGISFGLFMAGFAGHSVIPSLARDMSDPADFDSMVDWSFAVATVIYFLIGSAGYLMFGTEVDDEVSQNLLRTPGYSTSLNVAALWMLVISPLTKFALATRPVNITLEILLGLEPHSPSSNADDHGMKSVERHHWYLNPRRASWKRLFTSLERIALPLLSVTVSILVPQFSALMAFLGSFSAFMLCVIGPVGAKIALTRECGLLDATILFGGVVMAGWGTAAAIWWSV